MIACIVNDGSQDHTKYKDPDEVEQERALTNYDLTSLDLAYDEAKRILDIQFELVESLDTKASILVGLCGVALAALFGSAESMFASMDLSVRAGLIAAALAFVVSGVLGVLAYWPQTYETSPSIKRFTEKYLLWQPRNVKYVILHMFIRNYTRNSALIEGKVRRLKCSFFTLLLGILLLAVTLGYNVMMEVR